MWKLTIFVICLIKCGASGQDYCDKRLCTDYRGVYAKHIACDNNGTFASRCSPDAKVLPITNELKSIILKGFNDYRNRIARGSVPGYEPAADMTTMQWDDELANLAELNVKQCQMKHDKCRNTQKYAWSGQNLGYAWTTGNSVDPKKAFPLQIQRWADESNDCEQSVINKFRGSDNGITWGHFTVMVNHKSDRVGCAASQYVAETTSGFEASYILMACNFAYTNLLGEPVYRPGKPCSKCQKGCNKKYPALCATNERVKYLPDIALNLE